VCAERCKHGSGRGTRHTCKGQRSLLYIVMRPSENEAITSGKVAGTATFQLGKDKAPYLAACFLIRRVAGRDCSRQAP
jgi:hypothetical protein